MQRRQFLVAMSGAAAAAAVRPSRARAADPIRIGYFGPLTGNFSQTGKDMTDGFNLFWEEVGNKVAGREVKVIVEDSDPEPTGALTKVRRLVEQEKVHTVAGGLLAATGYALVPYIEQNKIPTVYPITAPDDITQRKPVRWIVRTSASGSQATHALGDYAYRQLNMRRVATVSMDYAFGWETNAGFQHVFEDLGGKVVQRIWTPLAMQDYAPYLASLKKDIDGVFACHTGGLSPRFIKTWSDVGLKGKIPLVGIGTLTDENILKGMGDEALGVITAGTYSAALDTPANRKWVQAMRAEYKEDPGFCTIGGYLGVLFLEAGLKAVNGRVEDKKAFLGALRQLRLEDTPQGPIRLDTYGNPVVNVYIRRVERRDGRLVNAVIDTYAAVSQFWKYAPAAFLANPVYSRDYPPAKNLE